MDLPLQKKKKKCKYATSYYNVQRLYNVQDKHL